MDAWLFSNSDRLHALTIDEQGSNLPAELDPWTLVRFHSLDGTAADEQEAIALIEEHGYCCFE
ncbi:hypothetical protein [Sphingomonas psychrotolerans]|uniref:Uncharacterized protein n=1 Tax=Sphingomonas psychrotolerans TaxID=1327635 RepID=A0A2K8MIZ5_9SPHN|nr:hypothetical protein [Sphingomonas psychrotolerans]ATY31161.1 hypothetical protein CVN68_03510 [Sphingomonas psychrotolerans]